VAGRLEGKAHTGPTLEAFKKWLMRRNDEVPPVLLLGKAVRYSFAQWDKMTAYLEGPRPAAGKNSSLGTFSPLNLTDTVKKIGIKPIILERSSKFMLPENNS
jgi:hypothetical protein